MKWLERMRVAFRDWLNKRTAEEQAQMDALSRQIEAASRLRWDLETPDEGSSKPDEPDCDQGGLQ